MWLFLFPSAMEMASSSFPSRSAPATCCTKMRDCLRAALYIRTRSIMTPTDHADMMKRRTTTVFAGIPIECHMLTMSQPTAWPCSQRLNKERLASIRFAPFRSFANGQADWLCGPSPPDPKTRGPAKSSARPAAASGTQRKHHVDRGDALHRLAVEQRGPIAPLPHGIKRRLHQQRMAGDHLQLHDRPILGNHRLQANRTLDARLLGQR